MHEGTDYTVYTFHVARRGRDRALSQLELRYENCRPDGFADHQRTSLKKA